jgi:FAD/FMN-containing dehydrogenase
VRVLDALRGGFGGRILEDDESRERYARDQSVFRVRPHGVAVAASEEDVVAVVRACRETATPLTVRSGGTGLAGGSIGAGLVLDVSALPARIQVEDDGRLVWASASATVDDVNAVLEPYGRRLGPDLTSSADARVGGIVGTNACGAGSNRFGRTADGVLSLDVVAGTGDRRDIVADPVEPPQGGFRRAPSGYAATDGGARSWCGSEGTLGVVLSARLRTWPKRPSAVGVLAFDAPGEAADAVPALLAGEPVAVELMDRLALRSRWTGDPAGLLIVETDGETRDEALAALGELADPDRIVVGDDASAERTVWGLRRSVLAELRPEDGRLPVALIEDARVDVERLGALIEGVDALAARWGVEIVHYGHAAAGTLHLRPLLDLRRDEHRRAAVAIVADHADLVASLGGSIASEHGLGLARSWLVPRAYPAETVRAWQALKAELDPDGIMNPGRVVPDRETFPAELLAG